MATMLLTFGFTNAQNDVDVIIKYETETVFLECRYCGEKGHNTYLEKIYFEDDKYTIPYNAVLQKLYEDALLSVLMDKDKMSKQCDISRSGKHGIEEHTEVKVFSKEISLEKMKYYASKQNLKELEQQELTNLNKSMLNCLDSFNIGFDLCVKNKDIKGVEIMNDQFSKLLNYQQKRDNITNSNYSKTYSIKIPANTAGFGGVNKEYSYLKLDNSIHWSLFYLGKFEDCIRNIDRTEKDYAAPNYYLKGWANFGLGNIDLAIDEFAKEVFKKGYKDNNFCEKIFKDCFNILYDPNYYMNSMKNYENFSLKNLIILQIKLMKFQIPEGFKLTNYSGDGTIICGISYWNKLSGGLKISDVTQILQISEKEVKKLIRKGVLKEIEDKNETQFIDCQSILFYAYSKLGLN